MNPLRIPISKLNQADFIDAIISVFPYVTDEIAIQMYIETKPYYVNIIYDMNTGELLQIQDLNGRWLMTDKYLKNVPTHENFMTLETNLSSDSIFNSYASKDQRNQKKKEDKLEKHNYNQIFDRIAYLNGDVEKLEISEKEWLKRYINSDDNDIKIK